MSDPLTDADDEASTPLTPAERAALIPSYVTQRRELNEIEQIGIAKAERWAFGRRHGEVLDERFFRQLHKRMFADVWAWAGTFSRETHRNIGLDYWEIEPALRELLDDVRFWVAHATYQPDEIAIRFHHRLVWIHPFPNGNGRLSRLAADVLAAKLGQSRFTWGSGSLVDIADLRQRYVEALRAADARDMAALIAFART